MLDGNNWLGEKQQRGGAVVVVVVVLVVVCVCVGEGLIKEVKFELRFEEVRMQAMGLSRGRML